MQTIEKCKAVVMERPGEVSFRDIKLTVPRSDAQIARTVLSSISSGTDMKTYRGLQPAQSLWYPCVPGYENMGVIVDPGNQGKFNTGDRVMINECRKFGDVCAAWGGSVHYAIKDSFTLAPSSPSNIQAPPIGSRRIT